MIKRVFQWLVILLMVALFARGALYVFNDSKDRGRKGDYVAVLSLEGVIYDSSKLLSRFEELEKKNNVKGYLLRINSPGGLVTPSQEIYDYLKSLKKPLYISMGSAAASGGYMAALAGKKIFAMPSTVTGSIGVIMQIPNYAGLMDKVGVNYKVIKSGEFKDAGNSGRAMTEREEAYLTGILMDMYDQFVTAVATSRGLDLTTAKDVSDGKVFTGRQALELNLIDALGSSFDALTALKAELGHPDMKHYEVEDELSAWKKMLLEMPNLLGFTPAIKLPSPGFYYMQEF